MRLCSSSAASYRACNNRSRETVRTSTSMASVLGIQIGHCSCVPLNARGLRNRSHQGFGRVPLRTFKTTEQSGRHKSPPKCSERPLELCHPLTPSNCLSPDAKLDAASRGRSREWIDHLWISELPVHRHRDTVTNRTGEP